MYRFLSILFQPGHFSLSTLRTSGVMMKSKKSKNRRSTVYDFFSEDDTEFTCTVVKDGNICCNAVMKRMKSGGGNSGNLKRHLMRHHPNEFDSMQARDLANQLALENGLMNKITF